MDGEAENDHWAILLNGILHIIDNAIGWRQIIVVILNLTLNSMKNDDQFSDWLAIFRESAVLHCKFLAILVRS